MSTDNATSDTLQPGDLIVDRATESKNGKELQLLACPICWLDFEDFNNPQIANHIGTHGPEEVGLDDDEYRYTPMADILIQLYGFDAEVDE